MVSRKYLLPAVLLTLSASAGAADNGFYLGAAIGQANVEIDRGLTRIDDNDTGYKAIVGFRPLDWLAVEANYINFGEPEDNNQRSETDGISAFVVGFLPIGPIDLFVKGGGINYDTSVAVKGVGKIYKQDGTEFAYGVGAQFRLLSLSVRAEYERFDVDNVDDLNMFSIGLTYTFL